MTKNTLPLNDPDVLNHKLFLCARISWYDEKGFAMECAFVLCRNITPCEVLFLSMLIMNCQMYRFKQIVGFEIKNSVLWSILIHLTWIVYNSQNVYIGRLAKIAGTRCSNSSGAVEPIWIAACKCFNSCAVVAPIYPNTIWHQCITSSIE